MNVGFISYREEWWHFDYCDQVWAKLNGTDSIYGAVYKGIDAFYRVDELSKYRLP
jgi:D-ala-D-ala dipeptidase